jgi:hypothetical protein
MRTGRTCGVLLAFVLLVVWGGAVGCKDHSDCEAIAVGTPLASLPHVWGPPNQSTDGRLLHDGAGSAAPVTWVALVLLVYVNDPDIVLAKFGGPYTHAPKEAVERARRLRLNACQAAADEINASSNPEDR